MNFKEIKNIEDLSFFLKTNIDVLDYFLNTNPTILDDINWNKEKNSIDDASFENSITLSDPGEEFWVEKMMIPKKNKKYGYRTVYRILNSKLQNIDKSISWHLNRAYIPGEEVTGFVPGRNIKKNAEMHLNRKVILNIDIKNFFESITEEMIKNVFLEIGCIEDIAIALAKLITINGYLVQGYCSSPILANMASKQIDLEFLKLADSFNAIYSRYADDICFSSNDKLPEIDKIIAILNANNFQINTKKTRYMYKGYKQYVTGLTVFDNKYPRIPKRFKGEIRLTLYYMSKFGIISHLKHKYGLLNSSDKEFNMLIDIQEEVRYSFYFLRGWIDYVNSIEPELALKFYAELELIIENFYKNKL